MSQNKIEEKEQSSVESKIEEMLITERKIFLSSVVDDKSAKEIIRKIWYLEYNNPGKPILFIINSPGGSVDSGFAIWDQFKMISSPVYTLVTGLAASMGSILSLVAGPGRRFATKHSRIMIHQPLIGGVIQGQATDLEIQAKEIIKTREALVEIYVQASGQSKAFVEKALDRDTWMSAEEAMKFGLLDGIKSSYKEFNMV